MARRMYTVAEKRSIIMEAKKLMSKGLSLRKTAEHFRLSAIQLSRWINAEDKLYEPNVRVSQVLLHPGNRSSLHAIKGELIDFISNNRKLGMPVSRRMVIMKASSLDPTFRKKMK